MIKIDNIRVNPDNPRLIKDDRFKKLVDSIKDFPKMMELRPIVVDKDGVILGGNMRYRALQELGYNEIDDSWVKVADKLTEEEKKRFIVEDNLPFGEWDWDKLANDFNIDDLLEWGFDEKDLKIDQEVIEDEAPEVSDEPAISKLGEVYQLGRHRLMCGDSTKIEDVEKLVDGKKADMVFTDPPYNIDYGSSKNPRHKIRNLMNDKQTGEGWEAFNNDWIGNMSVVLKGQGDVYVWGASSPEGMRQRLWLNELGYHWSATIIWRKQQLVLTPANYQRKYEPCFYGWRDKSSWQGSRTETEVWEIDRPLDSKEHPTMKPIALCVKGILNSSKIDDIVLDLFGGSGSTLIACEQTNRTCYMMELDEKYCDVIRKRYAKFIGKEEQWETITPRV